MSGVWKRSQVRTSEAPPDERGGNRYVRATATAPHLDSTGAGPATLPGTAPSKLSWFRTGFIPFLQRLGES
jgi:hypothetical protein